MGRGIRRRSRKWGSGKHARSGRFAKSPIGNGPVLVLDK